MKEQNLHLEELAGIVGGRKARGPHGAILSPAKKPTATVESAEEILL